MRNLAMVLVCLVGGSVGCCAARMLPPAPRAERELILVNWDVTSKSQRGEDLAVRSLQGIVNRKCPRIWVGTSDSPGGPGWWLDIYRNRGVVTTHAPRLGKDEFLHQYGSYASGVVVPPENLGEAGYRIAVMKAAVEDAIVGTRQLARKLDLPVIADYSTAFETYAQSWRCALDELWPKLRHDAIFVDRDDLGRTTSTVDYVVQKKLFLCGPHKDKPEEMQLFNELLMRLPLNSPVIGAAGGGTLASEGDVVRAVSKAGKVFVGCTGIENLSVQTGMRTVSSLSQNLRASPTLDRSKVYLAIELSDGDNSNVYFRHIPRRGLWDRRGQVPLGWTMGQSITELAPAVACYYFDTKTPLDEFVAGVSGYAYVFPGDFGNALTENEREKAWAVFLSRTDEYLDEIDGGVVTMLQYQEAPGVIGDEVFSRYASGLTRARGIINGYNAVFDQYGRRTCRMVDGLPVFLTVTDRTWSLPGDKTLADEVIERTPEHKPAFMTLFMLPMALGKDHFDQVLDSLHELQEKGYEIVLPSELADLAREASGSL